MKLSRARIREFKAVWDSGEFEVGHATCLVGKNEAGKTAVLQALYRLNPIVPADSTFDVTDDYPRASVEDYQQDLESGRRPAHTNVVEATFALDQEEVTEVEATFCKGVLSKPEITLSKGYAVGEKGACTLFVTVPADEPVLIEHLVNSHELPNDLAQGARKKKRLSDLQAFLVGEGEKKQQATAAALAEAAKLTDATEQAAAIEEANQLNEPERAQALRVRLSEILNNETLGLHIWRTVLSTRFPKFLYFDEYYQMRGHDNIQALKQREKDAQLLPSDHPLLGLIELARLSLEQMLNAQRTQELKNKLEGASNHLSKQILKYWSQNKHLRMQFDVRAGLPRDPEGMREGSNIWGEIFDSKHLVSTGLATRSRGFVWFFSFLAWYSSIKKKNESLVLLLDEPGLSLHGKAQEDLLRYFEEEIVVNPKHQLVYTTHSPFMVDPRHFERVRIVQDQSIDSDDDLPEDRRGTKVFTDVLQANPDSLFPLQGALGYEIHQTLFVGPNCLVVEGPSDLLYIQVLSALLERNGRTGLDHRWTITPAGGADRVPTFLALIGSQRGLKVATLIDYQKGDRQKIDNIYKSRLLKKSHLVTFADFTEKTEADIEDMFDEEFYLSLVNAEFKSALSEIITVEKLTSKAPRVLRRLEEYFEKLPLLKGASFNHYRPARYLAEETAASSLPAATLDRFESAFKTVNGLLKK